MQKIMVHNQNYVSMALTPQVDWSWFEILSDDCIHNEIPVFLSPWSRVQFLHFETRLHMWKVRSPGHQQLTIKALLCEELFCRNGFILKQKVTNAVGKLDIVWRTAFGERGRLQTSQLQRVVSILCSCRVLTSWIGQSINTVRSKIRSGTGLSLPETSGLWPM